MRLTRAVAHRRWEERLHPRHENGRFKRKRRSLAQVWRAFDASRHPRDTRGRFAPRSGRPAAVAPPEERLENLRGNLTQAAQDVYDDWDPSFQPGGICDLVADEMSGPLAAAGFDVQLGGQAGDDHAWLIVADHEAKQAFGVDIRPDVYETGGGYNWQKKAGVTFEPSDVDIWKEDYGFLEETGFWSEEAW